MAATAFKDVSHYLVFVLFLFEAIWNAQEFLIPQVIDPKYLKDRNFGHWK